MNSITREAILRTLEAKGEEVERLEARAKDLQDLWIRISSATPATEEGCTKQSQMINELKDKIARIQSQVRGLEVSGEILVRVTERK